MANEEIAHVDEGILAHLGVEEELVPLLQLLQVIGRWQISIRRRRHPYFKDDPVIVRTSYQILLSTALNSAAVPLSMQPGRRLLQGMTEITDLFLTLISFKVGYLPR